MYRWMVRQCDFVKHQLQVTRCELRVTSWKLKCKSWNLKVRVQIHELRVQINLLLLLLLLLLSLLLLSLSLLLLLLLLLIVIELTCRAETNLLSSREYKSDRYKELKNLCLVPCNDLQLILLEISVLGFESERVRDFKNLLNLLKCDSKRIMMCCFEVAIRHSYYIYCRRNIEWLAPEILKFVWLH